MKMQIMPLLLVSLHCVSIGVAAEETADPPRSNIFVQGDLVQIHVPKAVQNDVTQWRLLDDALNVVNEGSLGGEGIIHPGELPIGWYRIEFMNGDGEMAAFTTAAVIAALQERASADSPICIDVALSWHTEDPLIWKELIRLGALANVSWVRDRITWAHMEPEPGEFASHTKYDVTARMQNDGGQKILQVFHGVPGWAREDYTRRPRADFRDVYRFCKAMAERFKGQVDVWQPWNEGNAGNFGGFSIDELVSHQKAAYLGFKAGDPDVQVGWSPIGGVNTPRQAAGILKNVTWPYYDIYSIHSYDWPSAYENLWVNAREAASGREIWVTESDRGMPSDPESPVLDYTHEFDRRKGEFMAESYVSSYFAGASRKYHFILGPYSEHRQGSIQFGLLRHDYTPRISYVSFAALGRLLADGEILGRWTPEDGQTNDVNLFAFRARPDGELRDVLVTWVEEEETYWDERGAKSRPWPLPEDLTIETIYDHLGRKQEQSVPEAVTSAPQYIILPAGEADRLPLADPYDTGEYREGEASPVVFQLKTPGIDPVIRTRAWTDEPERIFEPNSTVNAQFVAYNLGETPATGRVSISQAPEGWEFSESHWEMTLEPMERQIIELEMQVPSEEPPADSWVIFEGDFGNLGEPVLAFQVFGSTLAEE